MYIIFICGLKPRLLQKGMPRPLKLLTIGNELPVNTYKCDGLTLQV